MKIFSSIDLNDNQMLRIAKNCTQISLFALHLNYVITDEALVNSIFANCPHLIQLTLKGCCELRGTFLAHLPLNVEYLFWNLIYLVSFKSIWQDLIIKGPKKRYF